MVPQTSDTGGESAATASVRSKSGTASDHVTSHDSHETTSDHVMAHDSHVLHPQVNLDSESFPLTAALRMSISGEGLGEQGDRNLRVSQLTGDGHSDSHAVELSIPEDLAVDLRVKLAVCLIYLGMAVPEVSVCVCVCMCVCVCAIYIYTMKLLTSFWILTLSLLSVFLSWTEPD